MNREEILDMAMDILDNTDATLEEAMGIAIESAENKMSDAEKYRRRRLKAVGTEISAARPGKYEGLSDEAEKGKTPNTVSIARRGLINRDDALSGYNRFYRDSRTFQHYSPEYKTTKGYEDMSRSQKRKIDRNIDKKYGIYSKETLKTVKARNDEIKKHPKYSDFDIHKREYRRDTYINTEKSGNSAVYKRMLKERKGAKEAAIMDTALDFLDMYDVSLEEAIDMAYDYLIG